MFKTQLRVRMEVIKEIPGPYSVCIMKDIQQEDVNGILNETSMTIHKHEVGAADFQTLCGQTYHLEHGQLREIQVRQATEKLNADKCGRCFEDGRGY